ncbi:hypothetical protein OG762_35875 [Streptomyces sp. NBC_01136]|uniref:hypothetical protein n=1 Tax=unclassified Streptomyces TaxID=2593676 RepID=UPI003251A6A0|nr:hypothetical protein OG762_35875 [Streptomyces sp. NBC_01136]
MNPRHTRAAALASLALAGAVAIGACGANGGATGTGTTPATSTATTPGNTPANLASGVPTPSGPTSGWGPGMWSGNRGPSMMGGSGGSWAPGMMGAGMMGNWWLAGNGHQVKNLDQARERATAFAGRLGLRVGEVMQFTRNFYAQLETTAGHAATEALVNPADGAVQIEYGPAMMWNTAYGMHYDSRSKTTISASQARAIAQRWLHDRGTTLAAGDPESFPGYYTLHTLQSGKITGMLSVNATTGQVWYHSWHGDFIAMSSHG